MTLSFKTINDRLDISFIFDKQHNEDPTQQVGAQHNKMEMVLLLMLLRTSLLYTLLQTFARWTGPVPPTTLTLNQVYASLTGTLMNFSSPNHPRSQTLIRDLRLCDRDVFRVVARLVKADYDRILSNGPDVDSNGLFLDQLTQADSVQRYPAIINHCSDSGQVYLHLNEPFFGLSIPLCATRSGEGEMLPTGSAVELWTTGAHTAELGQAEFRMVGLHTHIQPVTNTDHMDNV